MNDLASMFAMRPDDGASGDEHRIPWPLSGDVTNVDDSAALVRVKVHIEGMGENEESDWIPTLLLGSIEAKPNKGDPAIVFFLHGDPNRPLVLFSVTSTQKKRPTEAMVLGNTAWGVINNIMTQFNQLRTDFNNHTHQVPGTGTTCVNGMPWTGTATAATPTATGAIALQKGKAADGSAVSEKVGAEIVLSGKVKIRGSQDET